MTQAPATTRYESPTGWYELTEREPAPALRPFALAYWGREERSTRPVARLEVPYPNVVVSVSFGPSQRVGASTHGSFVAGLHETAVRTEHDGDVFGFQLALTPLAAHVLFRTPMHALASRSVELEELVGRDARSLAEDLPELPSWAVRFEALDAHLARRLAEAEPVPPEATWALRRLARSGGSYPIGRLAAELGWSRKRLVAQFRERVGLAPKTFARLLRFRRATTVLRTGERSLADLARECGYFDQAHFNRDFRAFAGITPTEFVGRLSPSDPGLAA
jgi:AraC-like DNA-binding protein